MSDNAISSQHTDYRADIDGLRAVAVLAVVGFHAFPRWLPGGFVGVDVFFVISGYLISSIIYNALREGRFSYLEFYVRRVKRIFPALLTVLATCLVAGWWLLLPDEYKQLGRQVAAGAGFGANLLFWSQAGYFDTDAAIKPLLHLWSLGIEEQFYLLWPLLIAFLYGRMKRPWVAVCALLAVSFVVNVVWVWTAPSATYYLPMSRLWELLSGALLAYWTMFVRRAEGPGKVGREALGWGGLALLGVSLVLIDERRAFPGYWALLPTVGTLCLIAGSGGWVNRRVLSQRVMVLVGLISYPLYLWHWVLLALLRMRLYEDGAEAPRLQRLAAVGLSVVLAWGTYRYIEKPIRFGRQRIWRPAVLVGLMAMVAGLGVAVDLSDGVAVRYPEAIRPLAAFQYDKLRVANTAQLNGRSCFVDAAAGGFARIGPRCIDPPDGQKRLVVLWGDSHAASLYPGLKALQQQRGDFRLAQFTASACPPIISETFTQNASCADFNRQALREIRALQPDTVVIEGSWWWYLEGRPGWDRMEPRAVRDTADVLRSFGVRRVVVMGSLPVWLLPQPKVSVKLWLDTGRLPERTSAHLNMKSLRADVSVRDSLTGSEAVFVSPISMLCNGDGCLMTTSSAQWTPLAWDAAHLTEAGATYLMSRTSNAVFGD